MVVPAALGVRLEWMVGLFTSTVALRLVLSDWLFRKLFRGVPSAPFPGGIREQLRYSVPLGVTRIAGIFNQKLDKFTVGLFFSASAFAEFAVASQELPLVSILPYSIAQILLPKLVEHYERGASRVEGARAAVGLWHVGIRKATLVMVPVAAFLLTMAEPLMEALYGARYRGAALPFRVYASLLPLRVTAYGIMLMAFGQTARILRSQIYGMVFNVVANITLLSLLGMIGAPLAAVLTQAFMIVYLVSRIDQVARVGIRGIFPWSFYARVALAACAGAAPLVAGVLLLPKSTPPVVLLLAGIPVFVAIYLLVANAVGVLAEEDRAYVMRWLRLEPLRAPRRGSP